MYQLCNKSILDFFMLYKTQSKLGLGICLALSFAQTSLAYDYDVSGYSDNGNGVYGNINAYRGSRSVDGYIYTDDGRELYFDGEWTGYGTVEGYDQEGNYVEMEVN
jgi:hypothetical protein